MHLKRVWLKNVFFFLKVKSGDDVRSCQSKTVTSAQRNRTWIFLEVGFSVKSLRMVHLDLISEDHVHASQEAEKVQRRVTQKMQVKRRSANQRESGGMVSLVEQLYPYAMLIDLMQSKSSKSFEISTFRILVAIAILSISTI